MTTWPDVAMVALVVIFCLGALYLMRDKMIR